MRVLVISAALVAMTVPAGAQPRTEVNVGGGFTAITGEIENHFGHGGQLNIGIALLPTETFGLHVEYGYTGLRRKTLEVPIASTRESSANATGLLSANMRMHGVSFDVIARRRATDRTTVYAVGGPGVYHRTADLSISELGFITLCDPYWYVCFPEAVVVEDVIGDRSSTDFGMNVGAGLIFRLASRASLYVETRYLYIWGPELAVGTPRIAGGDPVTKANGQFLPISFGVRW